MVTVAHLPGDLPILLVALVQFAASKFPNLLGNQTTINRTITLQTKQFSFLAIGSCYETLIITAFRCASCCPFKVSLKSFSSHYRSPSLALFILLWHQHFTKPNIVCWSCCRDSESTAYFKGDPTVHRPTNLPTITPGTDHLQLLRSSCWYYNCVTLQSEGNPSFLLPINSWGFPEKLQRLAFLGAGWWFLVYHWWPLPE